MMVSKQVFKQVCGNKSFLRIISILINYSSLQGKLLCRTPPNLSFSFTVCSGHTMRECGCLEYFCLSSVTSSSAKPIGNVSEGVKESFLRCTTQL